MKHILLILILFLTACGNATIGVIRKISTYNDKRVAWVDKYNPKLSEASSVFCEVPETELVENDRISLTNRKCADSKDMLGE